MNRVQGRNIYIVDLAKVVDAAGGPACFAKQCQAYKFQAIWVRLGHAQALDVNFSQANQANFAQIKAELANVGVAIWGWHVPQCPDKDSAVAEAALVNKCAKDNGLAGILLDAEHNAPIEDDPKQRYFQGGSNEADVYAKAVQSECQKTGRGLAFSGNDQPPKHAGFPFDVFLKYAADNCPQVYYGVLTPAARLKLSVDGYGPFEKGRDFKDRYKPVGNITVTDDVAIVDVEKCIDYVQRFMTLVKTGGYKGYSFWCWDQAPVYLWQMLRNTPV